MQSDGLLCVPFAYKTKNHHAAELRFYALLYRHTGHKIITYPYNILSFLSITTKFTCSKFIIWESRFYKFALIFTEFKRSSRCILETEICSSGVLEGAVGTHCWLGKEPWSYKEPQ